MSGLSPEASALKRRLQACVALALSAFLLLIQAPWWGSAGLAMASWSLAALLWQGLLGLQSGLRDGQGLVLLHALRALLWVGAGYSTAVEPGVIKLWDTLPLGWTVALLHRLEGLEQGRGELPSGWVDRLMIVALGLSVFQQAHSAEVAGAAVWAIKAALLAGLLIALGRLLSPLSPRGPRVLE